MNPRKKRTRNAPLPAHIVKTTEFQHKKKEHSCVQLYKEFDTLKLLMGHLSRLKTQHRRQEVGGGLLLTQQSRILLSDDAKVRAPSEAAFLIDEMGQQCDFTDVCDSFD
jgi:hypothetical protein